MAPGQSIDVSDLPPEMHDASQRQNLQGWQDALAAEADRLIATKPGEVYKLANRDFETTLIRQALKATGGRRIEAANLLGIGRNTITRKIQELGIDDGVPSAPTGEIRK